MTMCNEILHLVFATCWCLGYSLFPPLGGGGGHGGWGEEQGGGY